MFSHITLGVRCLVSAGIFYDAVLAPLGLVRRAVEKDGGPESLCWVQRKHPLPRFYTYLPFNGQPATAGNGTMVAFNADSPEIVDQSFAAAMAKGGTSMGDPGLRHRYGNNYYGAYFADPDGNKIHIVYRGD